MPRRYQIHRAGRGGGIQVSKGKRGREDTAVVGGSDECLIDEGTRSGTVRCTGEHFVILALSSSESHESFMTPRIDSSLTFPRSFFDERVAGRRGSTPSCEHASNIRFAWVIHNCLNVCTLLL